MKVALAHDFIRHGGAEVVLTELHRIWPDAPVHTFLYEPSPALAGWDIRSSWLQSWLPPAKYRWPLLLYPGMVDRLGRKLPRDLDLLVSSSVSWMKGVRAPEGVPHLCYIYRPMMFAYDRQDEFLAGYPAPLRPALRAMAARIRRWDQRTAHHPTHYLAVSKYTAERVQEVYGRRCEVVYPPVRIDALLEAGRRAPAGDYYLTMSRLESYKRVDVIVDACTRLKLPLKVAGKGPELEKLQARAGSTVEFLGYVPDAALPALLAGCRAFLFSAEEDFGIAPVEAAAAGRPVVAYGRAGSLETVLDGVTGVHYPEQTVDSLVAALQRLPALGISSERCREHAHGFSATEFQRRVRSAAERLLAGPGRGAGNGSRAVPQYAAPGVAPPGGP